MLKSRIISRIIEVNTYISQAMLLHRCVQLFSFRLHVHRWTIVGDHACQFGISIETVPFGMNRSKNLVTVCNAYILEAKTESWLESIADVIKTLIDCGPASNLFSICVCTCVNVASMHEILMTRELSLSIQLYDSRMMNVSLEKIKISPISLR